MDVLSRHLEKRLKRAFKDVVKGEAWFDEQTRFQYSSAACIYRVFPAGVIMPKDTEDVLETVRIARENNLTVTARGAGVGLTGGALGHGLIIDFSRYMRRILNIDAEHRTVRVEPGVVQYELDSALSRSGLFFPPDPSSHQYCTIGGMVGNNAGGPHSLKYGSTRDHVLRLSTVLPDGTFQAFDTAMVPDPTLQTPENERLLKLRDLLTFHRDIVRDHSPRTSKNASGYLLADFFNPDGSMNLTGLLTASEGTLGLFTEVELAVTTLPVRTGLGLLYFDCLTAAGEAIVEIRKMGPSMLEIMEDTFINLVRKSPFDIGVAFPHNLKVILLVEFEGDSPDEVALQLDALEKSMVGIGKPAISMHRGVRKDEQDRLLKIRKAASPILKRMPPPLQPMRFIEDGVVPVENLPAYIQGMHRIFERHSVTGVMFGHAGDGNLHVNPFMNLNDPKFPQTMESMALETAELIGLLDGSLSGEHGDGFLRTPLLPIVAGKMYSLFREIKHIFDPDDTFNPDKIVGGENAAITDNLRYVCYKQLKNDASELGTRAVADELFRCSGCGACRSYCPVYLATRDEMSTPRSKSNLITHFITSLSDDYSRGLGKRERQILDLCISCDTCLHECPSGTDIAFVMQQAKQIHNDAWGFPMSERLLANTGRLSQMGTVFPRLSNRLLNNRFFRYALQAFMGIDARRYLPGYAEEPFTDRSTLDYSAPSSGASRTAYMPGCYAIFHDPEGEGMAVLAILSHHDSVPVIPQMHCCGIAAISVGLGETIRTQAIKNVDELYILLKQNYRLIGSAPSCQLAIRHHYSKLIPTPESVDVAAAMVDIHELLTEWLGTGRLDTEFQALPYRIALHQPCHSRALGIGELPGKLLRLIPGLEIHELEPNCCGMAGTFGVKHKNYDLSMEIGRPVFSEITEIQPDLIVTPCGTCRMQLEQATGIPAVHPVRLLAEAYGLIAPAIESAFPE